MLRLLACVLVAHALLAAAGDPLAFVNPLIGTKKSTIGYGGTMPFVSPPFGMTNWTPQTRQNKISITSYDYDDKSISGLHRHSSARDLDGRLRLRHSHAAGRRTPHDT